jgi:hypothetical protein
VDCCSKYQYGDKTIAYGDIYLVTPDKDLAYAKAVEIKMLAIWVKYLSLAV